MVAPSSSTRPTVPRPLIRAALQSESAPTRIHSPSHSPTRLALRSCTRSRSDPRVIRAMSAPLRMQQQLVTRRTNAATSDSGSSAESAPAVGYPPPPALAKDAYISSMDQYREMYDRSLKDNDGFWAEMATTHVEWMTPFKQVKVEGQHGTPDTRWFEGGRLNASVNCVDRHARSHRANKTAIIWESDDGKSCQKYTFKELHVAIQRAANALRALGVRRGTTVALYMPMVPEAVIAMLACARLGAPHNTVFAGFSAEALRERVHSSHAVVVITSDELLRGGKTIPLKPVVDRAVAGCHSVKHVLVLKRTGGRCPMTMGRDRWWHDEVDKASPHCEPEPMESEDPLFTLFTSGSTGKPKGLVHSTGGFLVYAAVTAHYAFDLKDSDVFACGADIGWITGHSYVVYGPLCLGATTLLYEGHPSYPHAGRYWEVVAKHRISVFYTSPTAVRSLMAVGDEEKNIAAWDRSSLRILGSVGEPINPAAWDWFHKNVGDRRAPIVDTYWQTETGGIMLCPLPGATTLKPGAACQPFFGIDIGLFDDHGNELPYIPGRESTGLLAVKRPWPGLARTILGDHQRYTEVYFSHFKRHKGIYVTGDNARRDADGYWWISGRADDVVNVSGHRVGSAEVESAIVTHQHAAEAAVVAMPHKVKGEALAAFVACNEGSPCSSVGSAAVDPAATARFEIEVRDTVAQEIGKLAVPDLVIVVKALPKTRSGKIMRIVLGKTDPSSLGDTSTLADPSVVDDIIRQVAQAQAKLKAAVPIKAKL